MAKPTYPNLRYEIQQFLEGNGNHHFDTLYEVLQSNNPDLKPKHLQMTLRWMRSEGKVQRDGNILRWAAPSKKTSNGVRPYRDDGSAAQEVVTPKQEVIQRRPPQKIKLPEFQAQRKGHLVTLEVAPEEYPDVVQIQLCIARQWINLPFNAPVRFCFGENIPKWAPSQEINTGLSAIRLVYADGSFDERDGLNPNQPFVVAFA